MNVESSPGLAAEDAAFVELSVIIMGQNHAFGLIAGRCSAAQADGLRHEKQYKRCTEKWDDFRLKYLKMSRVEADRTIKLLEEFGPAYFRAFPTDARLSRHLQGHRASHRKWRAAP
jgi:hypothetical protein